MRSWLQTTSAAVNASPEWNFTPWRRCMTMVLPPSRMSQDSARSGSAWPSGVGRNRDSYTLLIVARPCGGLVDCVMSRTSGSAFIATRSGFGSAARDGAGDAATNAASAASPINKRLVVIAILPWPWLARFRQRAAPPVFRVRALHMDLRQIHDFEPVRGRAVGDALLHRVDVDILPQRDGLEHVLLARHHLADQLTLLFQIERGVGFFIERVHHLVMIERERRLAVIGQRHAFERRRQVRHRQARDRDIFA